MINFILLISRQGKLRLAKWYHPYTLKQRTRLATTTTNLVLARKSRACSFISHGDQLLVYKRYASLFFVAGCSEDENELLVLEILHRFVECLDRYFENVCELDLIFNFQKAHYILDEFVMGGQVLEPSIKAVLHAVRQTDDVEQEERDERRLF